MSIFYDHIVQIHHIHAQVETLPTKSEHKKELIELIEETVHHHILHKILDKLHEDHHHSFLDKFHTNPRDEQLMVFLLEHIPSIEKHIQEAAEEIKYDLIKTIRES